MLVSAKSRVDSISRGRFRPYSRQLPHVARGVVKFATFMRLAFWRVFQHDDFAIAKASAYSSILTFFPALIVIGAILATSSRFDLYATELSEALQRILPAGGSTVIQYLQGPHDRPIKFLVSTSILTIWTASGVVISWMEGFRNAYQLPKTWGLVKERLIACSLVILAELPLTFATVLVAFGTPVESRILFHIGQQLGSPLIIVAETALRWAVATVTSVAVIALIYHNAIPRTQPWHKVLPGAALATGIWFAATLIFGWYVHHYADYSVVYGSFGVGIALLVWMYLVSFSVLVGAEFNALLFPRKIARQPAEMREREWRLAA